MSSTRAFSLKLQSQMYFKLMMADNDKMTRQIMAPLAGQIEDQIQGLIIRMQW